jgi:hypothetical protein
VIVGGGFSAAGGVAARNIARHNPTTNTWSALGSGTNSLGVYALALLPGGDVIVGGLFTTAGGVAGRNYIARYSPTTNTWSALGSGTSGLVRALAVLPGGDVIVGGFFSNAGGVAANNIARYNPSTNTWSALGSGTNSSVWSLAVLPGGDVIVGGDFNLAGGVAANRIARYNPTTNAWSALGSGVGSGMNGTVAALAVLPGGDVIVGGGFDTAGGAWANSIARWGGQGAALLFRESDNASWTWGPGGIPGWDHVGLLAKGRVYESHPGYGNGTFWDPVARAFVAVSYDDGVQWQHTRGSFQHDSPTTISTAGNLAIGIPVATACAMASFIETQGGALFLEIICPSLLDLTCWQTLAPDRQKGRFNGSYTCVGLVERAAEEAGLNGGQGFIPNSLESFNVALLGEVPVLSPMVLSWFAQSGFYFADGALFGLLDPVDFVLTDPAGRRLGHTAALGTLNEIPGALYTGSGTIEQFLIPSPMPGQYQLRLVGVGGNAGVAVGGAIPGFKFEGMLPAGATRDMPFVVLAPCPADITNTDGDLPGVPDGAVDNGDFQAFFTAFFMPEADPLRLAADIANTDGETVLTGGGPDGAIDNGDFNAFFAAFFGGCP